MSGFGRLLPDAVQQNTPLFSLPSMTVLSTGCVKTICGVTLSHFWSYIGASWRENSDATGHPSKSPVG